MDKTNLALLESLMSEVAAVKESKRTGVPNDAARSDQEMAELLSELEANGLGRQVSEELNARRHRAIRPDVGPSSNYRSSRGPFATFGAQMQAVINAGMPGGETNRALFEVRSATGLSESIPSDSGFLVQTDFSNKLLEGVDTQAIIKPMCMQFPIGGNSNSIKINAFAESSRVLGSRFGGVRSYWTAEAAQKTASQPKFRQMELTLKKLIGLVYCTDESLQDIPTLERVVTRAFISEIAFQCDDSILNGTGAGQPLGVMSSPSLVTVTRAGAGAISYADITGMFARLMPGVYANAAWFINQDCIPSLYSMILGTIPAYLPANGLAGQPFPTLMGLPVHVIEQAQSLGTTGDIILGSFGDGYIWTDKGAVKTDVSIHLRFIFDEQVLRFVYRCDGQPVLATSLVPASGSANTVSHFICLS